MRIHFAGFSGVRPPIPVVTGEPVFDEQPEGGLFIDLGDADFPYQENDGRVTIPDVNHASWVDNQAGIAWAPGTFEVYPADVGMNLTLSPEPGYIVRINGGVVDPNTLAYHFDKPAGSNKTPILLTEDVRPTQDPSTKVITVRPIVGAEAYLPLFDFVLDPGEYPVQYLDPYETGVDVVVRLTDPDTYELRFEDGSPYNGEFFHFVSLNA